MTKPPEISFDTSKHDAPGNHHFCVILASWAYLPQTELAKALRDSNYCGPDVVVVRSSLTSCFIIRWGDVTAIAFRGSTTWREWLNNLNVWLEPVQHGRVHAGFWHTIKQIGPRLLQQIVPDLLAGQKIVLTGHSRGGPLATLFAYYLLLNGHRAFCSVEFGAPKMCDPEFACFWQGVPYEPKTQPNGNFFTRWFFGIKPVFVIGTLYATFRYLYPYLRPSIGQWFMRFKVINLTVAFYRSVRAFIGRRL